jgi:mRNA deadenylase 3'-5' endonuclease subunit Ccr4
MEPIRSREEMEHLFRLLQSQTEPPPGGGERIKIMSWNILADAFVSQQYFPYVNSNHLLYSYRIENIVM